MSASPAYALRAECRGHEDDVRGVAVVAPDAFATCSRDGTVRVWREAIGDDGYATAAVCVGHASFVTALARVPANGTPSLSSGGLVSGGRDKSVILWRDGAGEPGPVAKLEGHSLDVTAVCVLRDGTIVSGSMDKSIRLWDAQAGTCVKTLADAHGSSVLALVALPDTNGFLSGSADKTIKRWTDAETLKNSKTPEPAQTLLGHGDTVRGLAVAPGAGFLSASHDCTARLWTRDGETAAIFAGHAALVYSVAFVAAGEGIVVTGSEDNTCRLWNPADGSCVQTLAHPGCVWAVAAFRAPEFVAAGGASAAAEGAIASDIVTCCADGVARVWTRDGATQDAAAQKRLDDALVAAAEAKAAAALADSKNQIKTEPPEALQTPGDADGATKVIRETGGSVAAYAWSAGTQSWERLGEVTGVGDGSASDGKKRHDGASYDFVFDVDIAEGAPTLKLPFNVGDNPYDAAERFLETNGLDPGYREQVVNFIVQNVGEDAFAGAGANLSADPFTGAGAYVPGARSAPASGGSRSTKYVPAKPHQCVVFPTAAFDKMLAKLGALGAAEEELRAFASAASFANVAGTGAAASPLGPDVVAILESALRDWPVESLFPLLDLSKALAPRFDAAGADALGERTAGAMAEACARAARAPATDANQLTAARLFANAFRSATPRRAFLSRAPQILDGLAACARADTKPAAKLALATALLNFSAHFATGDDEAVAAQAASVGAELALCVMDGGDGAAKVDDTADAIFFRALVALGTMAAKSPETKATLRDLGVAELAEAVTSRKAFAGGKAVQAAEDVKKALA